MPTGSQVISDNSRGGASSGFFSSVLGSLSRGVDSLVDLELAKRAGSQPDIAEVRTQAGVDDPSQPTFGLGTLIGNPVGATVLVVGAAAIGIALAAALRR